MIVTLCGLLLLQLSLGSWGTFYLRPWVPEPLQCYRCHRFGHHQASCANVIKCGMCTGFHETQECLVKYKVKQDIVHRCPNCNQTHHAWNKACSARLRLVERGRERQYVWLANQQKTATILAPPSTFVWDQQLPTAPPPAPCPTPADFPPLPPTTVSPRQPPITNLPPSLPMTITRNSFHSDDRPALHHTLLTTYYLFTLRSPLHFLHPDTRHVFTDFPFSVQ